MYRTAVQADFIAQHYLIGGDWGRENDLHSHHYVVEVEVSGSALDRDGLLADVDDLQENLDQRVSYFEEQVLNDLPEFEGVNPTPEQFARVLAEVIASEVESETAERISVRLWQNESTWVGYEMELAG